MRQIKFIRLGSNTATGNFGPGDMLRCSDDVARHFVEAARCAVYVGASPSDKPAGIHRPGDAQVPPLAGRRQARRRAAV